MPIAPQHRPRRFRAPTRETGEAIGFVTYQGQVVGNRDRRDTELGDDAGLVDQSPPPPVELHDAITHDALSQVLVRRANQHPRHRRIGSRHFGSGSKRIVGFVLHHCPDGQSHRGERFLERRELGEQLGGDARAILVTRPEVVAERLDDVVGCDRDVG